MAVQKSAAKLLIFFSDNKKAQEWYTSSEREFIVTPDPSTFAHVDYKSYSGLCIFPVEVESIIEYKFRPSSFYLCKKIRLLSPVDVIECNGSKIYTQGGIIHRDDDLPAVIFANGDQIWYQNGLIHRSNDLPAVVFPGWRSIWYQNGLTHRDNDLPAVIIYNGRQEWWQNGLRHRDGGKPAVINPDGTEKYWINGKEIVNGVASETGPSVYYPQHDVWIRLIEYASSHTEKNNNFLSWLKEKDISYSRSEIMLAIKLFLSSHLPKPRQRFQITKILAELNANASDNYFEAKS